MTLAQLLSIGVLAGAASCGRAPAGPPATHEVEIRDSRFAIPDRQFEAGDSIVFVNRDLVPHRVLFEGALSPELLRGHEWVIAIGAGGAVACPYHPAMEGAISLRR